MTAQTTAAPSGTAARLPAPWPGPAGTRSPMPGRWSRARCGSCAASRTSLILALVLPVMLMILFVYVFGGAMSVGTDYVTYATPGIILLCAGYGASNTAIAVEQDMSGGIMDRFRSMPIASWTVLVGHVVASVVKNLVTTAVVLGVAFLIGFRPDADALEWLGAVGVVAAYVFAITSIAAFLGVLVRSPAAAGGSASSCSSCRTCRARSCHRRPCRRGCAGSRSTSPSRR